MQGSSKPIYDVRNQRIIHEHVVKRVFLVRNDMDQTYWPQTEIFTTSI